MSAPVAGRVILAGCGNMGSALLRGWCAPGAADIVADPAAILVVEPDDDRRAAARAFGVGTFDDAGALPPPTADDVVVLAVKPQVIAAAVPPFRAHAAVGALILSVAAGRTLGFLAALLGGGAIVRAMPNTPAAVAAAITVACANAAVTPAQRARATALLAAVGSVAWIEDEALLDAVTAVSGSGPAYVFLLAEALAEAGIGVGLPADLAARLARDTVIGAARLLAASDAAPEALRQQVTSPGGTTAAALAVLAGADGLPPLLARAVAAATARSRELAQAT